jgi:hypothetical protein
MAAPNPYQGTPEDFGAADWKEFCRAWSPGTGTFTHSGAEQALVGFVPEAKELAAIRYMLGYGAIGVGSTRSLLRTAPVAHPKYPNLFCTGVSTAPYQPDARLSASFSVDGRGIRRPNKNTNPDGGRPLPYFTGYRNTQLTLHFEPLTFSMEEDTGGTLVGGGGGSSVTNGNFEYRRWCTWDLQPRVETLALDGSSLAFAEGDGNTAPTSRPIGERFPAEVGKLIVKADLTVKWHMVPADWVETPNRIPHKILKGLGKVNRYSFGDTGATFSAPAGTLLDYPVGTLLFSACKIDRRPNTLYHPGTAASLTLGRESKTLLDVEFLFSFFDPPKGRDSNAVIDTDRGHNNFLWRGAQDRATGALVTGDKNAGKWFLATYSGSKGTSGNPEPRLFDPFNFAMLFDSWQNTMQPDQEG